MRVLIAGLMAAAATISAVPASAVTHKVSCLCDCPDDVKARPQHHAMAAPAPRPRAVHRVARTRSSYGYNYASAAPIRGGEWHGAWRVAPNDMIPAYDSPPPSYPAPAYGGGYYAPVAAPVYVPRPGIGSVPGAVYISPPPGAIYAAPVPPCRIIRKRVFVDNIGWSWARETACEN